MGTDKFEFSDPLRGGLAGVGDDVSDLAVDRPSALVHALPQRHPYLGIFRDKGVQKKRNGGADYHAARRELTARRSATIEAAKKYSDFSAET